MHDHVRGANMMRASASASASASARSGSRESRSLCASLGLRAAGMTTIVRLPRWRTSPARVVCALAVACLLAAAGARAQTAEERDRRAREAEAAQKLEAVRTEIKQLAEAQRALEGERAQATQSIREADHAVDAGARALRDIDAAIAERETELAKLEADKAALQRRLRRQREALAELLRSAYALGRHEQLKLLLAQDKIDDLARVLAYHRYFQKDRVGRIQKLLDELRALADIGRAVTAKREELASTRRHQQARIGELETQRFERRALLVSLDARFADAKARLAALGRDEKALVKLLASLRDVFADIPRELDGAQPFPQRRGQLPMPVAGKLVAAFGAAMPDGRTSQGWLLAAKGGEAVHALAPGRVAFADWLKGYGLLVIVDHGDGWMSLYAQNDSLLKEAGDWVRAGETLAGVGTSGGQSQPGLYLELRQNGKPVNPKGWFKP